MQTQFTAIIKRDGDWWLGWVKEIPGANAQEKSKGELIISLQEAAKDVLKIYSQEAVQYAESNYEEIPLLV